MPDADAAIEAPPPDHLREADNSLSRHGRYDQELPSTWAHEPNFEPTLPYYGFDHVELAIGHGDKAVGHYARWLKARHPNPDSLRGPENQLPGNRYTAPQAWRTRMPEELYPTAYVAERTMMYLENYARTDRSRPFYLQCSFPDPHHPFTPPGRYWDMYDPETIRLPSSFHAGERADPAAFKKSLRRARAEQEQQRWPTHLCHQRARSERGDRAHLRHDFDDRRCCRQHFGLAENAPAR